MECVLALPLKAAEREHCARVLSLLLDDTSTAEQLRAAAYAAAHAAAYAAHAAAYAVHAAASATHAAAYAVQAAAYAAYAAHAVHAAYAAATNDTKPRDLLTTKLMLLVG
jgi:hypothetical protein